MHVACGQPQTLADLCEVVGAVEAAALGGGLAGEVDHGGVDLGIGGIDEVGGGGAHSAHERAAGADQAARARQARVCIQDFARELV